MVQILIWSWLLFLHLPWLLNGESCKTWHNGAFTQKVDLVASAKCLMKPTTNNPNENLNGNFIFKQDPNNNYEDIDEGVTKIIVEYSVSMLTNGDHTYHVHRYGDTFGADGSTTGSHFVGVTNSRPVLGAQEVGLLNDGTPVQSDGGESSGSYVDEVASMNDYNSILGRGMIIHGTDDDNPLIRASQCVIGMTGQNSAHQLMDSECITKATCGLVSAPGSTVTGTIEIETQGEGETKKLFFKVVVFGLGDDTYKVIAHVNGDISDNGQHTGGVFGGKQVTRTAGHLGGTAFSFQSKNKWASVSFEDTVVGLNGPNSILGRSLVIEDDRQNVYAFGVVGLAKDVNSPLPKSPSISNGVPQITSAAAVLRGTTPNLYGYVELFLLESDHWLGGATGSRIRYQITGLQAGVTYNVSVNQYIEGNGGIFVGWNVTREKVGAWEHFFTADATGVAKGEFIDHFTQFNDYNSILGRSIVVWKAGTSVFSSNNILLHGVIGLLSSHATLDYTPAPIDKAKVVFDIISLDYILGTYGWFRLTKQGGYDYDLFGMLVNHTYKLKILTTGDLFSIYDQVNTIQFARAQFTTLLTINTNGIGSSAASRTSGVNVQINGANSVLGKVIVIEEADTYQIIAAGVLGIDVDDVSYTPPEIHCVYQCPVPATLPPTFPVAQPNPSPPTPPPANTGRSIVPALSSCVLILTVCSLFSKLM